MMPCLLSGGRVLDVFHSTVRENVRLARRLHLLKYSTIPFPLGLAV
jgi:hypothetical protein